MKQEIEIGSLVRVKNSDRKGIVSAILDGMYYVDCGGILKFPAKKEWIEMIKRLTK